MPKTHRIYHGHVLDTDGSIVDEVPIVMVPSVALFIMMLVSYHLQ